MKTKSVSGFVTGLLGIVAGVPIGFYAYIVLALVLGLSNHNTLAYSVYLFLVAGIVATTGLCFYFTKAMLGGVFMLIATVLYVIPFCCGLYALISNNGNISELPLALIIGNIPTILLIISTVLGLKSKKNIWRK